jgi:hypothetical protein
MTSTKIPHRWRQTASDTAFSYRRVFNPERTDDISIPDIGVHQQDGEYKSIRHNITPNASADPLSIIIREVTICPSLGSLSDLLSYFVRLCGSLQHPGRRSPSAGQEYNNTLTTAV